MTKIKAVKNKFETLLEKVWNIYYFSFSLVFDRTILKIMWIILAITTYFRFGLTKAILFTVFFAALMIYIVALILIGFRYVFPRNRD